MHPLTTTAFYTMPVTSCFVSFLTVLSDCDGTASVKVPIESTSGYSGRIRFDISLEVSGDRRFEAQRVHPYMHAYVKKDTTKKALLATFSNLV